MRFSRTQEWIAIPIALLVGSLLQPVSQGNLGKSPVTVQLGSANIATINTRDASTEISFKLPLTSQRTVYHDALHVINEDAVNRAINLNLLSISGEQTNIKELALYLVEPDGVKIVVARILNGSITQESSGLTVLPPNIDYVFIIVIAGNENLQNEQTITANLQLTVQ